VTRIKRPHAAECVGEFYNARDVGRHSVDVDAHHQCSTLQSSCRPTVVEWLFHSMIDHQYNDPVAHSTVVAAAAVVAVVVLIVVVVAVVAVVVVVVVVVVVTKQSQANCSRVALSQYDSITVSQYDRSLIQ